MKTFFSSTLIVLLLLGPNVLHAQTTITQLPNLPIESKLDWATWRTDIYIITTYPKGKFELLTESNLMATMKWNRPYTAYFENGLVFGVSLEEFESVLYGHAKIMTKRIGIDFKYDIKGDTVFCTLKRYR